MYLSLPTPAVWRPRLDIYRVGPHATTWRREGNVEEGVRLVESCVRGHSDRDVSHFHVVPEELSLAVHFVALLAACSLLRAPRPRDGGREPKKKGELTSLPGREGVRRCVSTCSAHA
jgi:hypothetical protein